MTEIVRKKLSDSKAARWTALAVVSLTMMCAYFLSDCMAPLEDLLVNELNWTSTEYGFLSGAYSYFNVFLLMLIIGGLILDKKGVRFTGKMACLIMIAGASIKFYAISPFFPLGGVLFGMNSQVVVAIIGFATFGVGAEIAGITVSKVIVKWFTGHELALAMGLQLAVARLGTAMALSFALPLARHFNEFIAAPLLLGLVVLCIGAIAYFLYCTMDKKLDESAAAINDEEESFKFSDVKLVLTNKGFWLIAILCVLFYSSVFPFLKFAVRMMIYKYGVEPELAGFIPSLLPIGTIFLTPLFGTIYDRIGKGASLMIIGSFMLVLVHLMFAMPFLNVWWFATINMLVLGVAFSLVPSAMWPSLPKIVPLQLLGTAYSLVFYVQNIGLALVPILIGWTVDRFTQTVLPDGTIAYNYTVPMLVSVCFSSLACVFALWLKAEDKKKGYGLQQANIKK
ncbi:MFS transporter [Bacteroides sp. 214]|uniref:MFS transporter n=1 Tax=Bacteroides sp. 214 TaxID=2302935 RepID=UPI0013D5F0E9|nr:MFS transporter [Bacteroides sp. 214]NDW13363.1 MFS transporter [Bacteroides sp. 214]